MDTLSLLDDGILGTLDQEADINIEIDRSSQIRRDIHMSIISVDTFSKKICNLNLDSTSNGQPDLPNLFTKNAKLPKLSNKSFSGNPLDCQNFWDCFEASVHSNSALDNIVKLNYLKMFLKGLSLTSENYRGAVSILEKRYGNKQLLINSHVEKMMGIAPVRSVREIEKTIEVDVRNVNSLRYQSIWSSIMSIIMSKFVYLFHGQNSS